MHKWIPNIVDKLNSAIIHPEVIVSPETEEYLKQNQESKNPIILAPNHVRYGDHSVISASVQKVPMLAEQMLGNTIAIAKEPYFQNMATRWFYDQTNGVPAIRPVDIAKEKGILVSEVNLMEAGRPGHMLKDLCVNRLSLGQNLLIYPEGTRNRDDWEEMLPLEAAMGYIATEAWKIGIDAAIIPVAIAYDRSKMLNVLTPVVRFGKPITKEPDMKHHLVTDLTATYMQYNVDLAYAEINKH